MIRLTHDGGEWASRSDGSIRPHSDTDDGDGGGTNSGASTATPGTLAPGTPGPASRYPDHVSPTNRLAAESSPYLRQHAENPVDWYPWGTEAFAKSAEEDKPIFLSIGYSACHWCHVMAHESFEDPVVADRLNNGFVSIKVDREERPDVDAVYMEAVQAMTGSGGWPMSVFLTPDRRPFYGGTYFPPSDLQGRPSFTTVLDALCDIWANRRSEVEEQADELAGAIAARSVVESRPGAVSLLDAVDGAGPVDLLTPAVEALARRFDPEWGGFGGAPKFPQPSLVDMALRQALRLRGRPEGDRAAHLATRTLDAMAAGGIHDQLGGGFARYATDSEWLVPHFEKMLYDQAGLLRVYLHGWQVTGDAIYLGVAEGIVSYVARDLTAPEGGVYSAEDADSEGIEGKFYVWTPDQVRSGIAGADGDAVARAVLDWFDVTPGGNFEGATILRRPVGDPLVGSDLVEEGRRRLLAARSARVRPGLDDKVLTEWNAMYASALAEAAAAAGRTDWATAAVGIGRFLCDNLVDDQGRWLRSWQRQGGARHLAYAADHAWLVDCFTRLAELTGEAVWTDAGLIHRRRSDRPIRRRRRRRLLHHGRRRRTADRAHQGRLRRGHPVGQRRGCAGPGPARCPHRRHLLHRARPPGHRPDRRPPHPPPDGLRPHRPDRRHAGPWHHRGGGDR